MNKKVLFILHLPPPVHGSSMVGLYIKDSVLVNQELDSCYVNLGTSKTIDEIGKKPFKKIGAYLKIIANTFRELLLFKPDVVYLAITAKGVGFYKDMLVVFLVKLFGVPLVLHFHNKGVCENQDRFFDHLLYSLLFKNTKVILLSKYLYDDVKKYVKESNVYYCPNGIPEMLSQNKREIHKSKTVQLLFLSNLIASKGVFILLEACKQLVKNKISFFCTFVGGEGDISNKQFQEKVNAFGLQCNVRYVGRKYGVEKVAAFQQSDVFILPTYSECFPLVLLEAMQFGLPIVSTFEGGIRDIVDDGVTGFLVPQENVTLLAEKLEMLINSTTLGLQMGESGRIKYESEFTLAIFENCLVSILKMI